MSDAVIQVAKAHLKGIQVEVLSQGAEAVVFETKTHPYLPASIKPKGIRNTDKYIIKYRPPKSYRHPILDAQLTKHRTLAEARLLQRLTNVKEINSPNLIAIDSRNGFIWMEFIGENLKNGYLSSLKNWIWQFNEDKKQALSEEVQRNLIKVGEQIGNLHLNDIVHGDLTSSNIVLQRNDNGEWEVYLIDFGLGSLSTMIEDKGVDLYVLERAILSTHPLYSSQYNEWIFEGYSNVFKGKDLKKHSEIIRRYEDVRLRGRKRSMIG